MDINNSIDKIPKYKIGLIGFGKTGKAVANVILQNQSYSLEWVLRKSKILDTRSVPEFFGIESNEPGYIYSLETISIEELIDKHPVDFIIDFSSISGIYTYHQIAATNRIKIISAISHYNDKEIQILNQLAKSTAVFWSPNITLGVNYLIFVAKILKKIAPLVDIEIIEEHFKGKEGASGTAIRIAETLELDKENINSLRLGGVVGRHEVVFGFPFQTVRLIHESISREAFGNGVIFVADNLIQKDIGMYKFEDFLSTYFSM